MKILGVDTGGTFTDFVLFDGKNIAIHKELSTPRDPSRAIFKGINHIKEIASINGLALVHGSTVATNALLERKGAKTALITTKGFEDIIEIGRQARPELYNLFVEQPPPLIPKELRWSLTERVDSKGAVLCEVNRRELKKIKAELIKSGITSVAVCFLFSYINSRNEETVYNEFATTGIHVSASHKILPEYREYERFCATTANARISPIMAGYITSLEKGLDELDINNVRIMQSNGGSISTAAVKERAINCALSGPAGGVIGALKIAKRAGITNIISFDMGGTSTDVSLCDGAARMASNVYIGGTPLKVPIIDIYTVGAGGGSIAEVDPGGALRVGPQSAGADPGPVCYGKGEQITVTDANLFLGRISAEHFLGGRMELNATGVTEHLNAMASSMKMSAHQLAEGIINVANSNMERAVKVISIERGFDARDFTLVSFGGAGGLHACELAARLAMQQVLIPKNAGVLSALGMIHSDIIKDYQKSVLTRVVKDDFNKLSNIAAPLITQCVNDINNEGVAKNSIKTTVYIDIRYFGQSFELTLPLSKHFIAAFHNLHKKSFGYSDSKREVEAVNLRVRGIGLVKKPAIARKPTSSTKPAPTVSGTTKIYWNRKWIEAKVYDRDKLPAGSVIKKPAIIAEETATTFLPPGHICKVDEFENLVLENYNFDN